MSSRWQYYGRSGPSPSGPEEIYEIYRRPYSDEKLEIDTVRKLERLRSNGEWVNDPNDMGLFNEMRSGWFDYEDELSEERVNQLIEEWKVKEWPGRP
ncbi:MAG TPA: hypothetical protein VJ302_17760 [Blastocatellia bacterium]|nr:hypothetical protein [Blastocatellia bacterium]